MTALLKVVGVSKRFGATTALQEIDLEVGTEELVVVLGPTGAGKTTLLRIIAGLDTPDSGRLELGGQDITAWLPAQRDVAFVFQDFSLYPDWSVRQNMAFPLKAPGRLLSDAQVSEQVEWAADLLQISALLERPAAKLSGGEMQRVAIGRAIVRRPRLFLFDEPLTNLDAKLRESLRVELVVLQRRLKIPMVYVTHDQAEALSMGERLVVISDGKILQSGTPEEVYSQPASPLVAAQVGQPKINLIAVQQVERQWVTPQGTPVMPATTRDPTMILGIRPEDIELQGGQYPGYVRVVEDSGPAWILVVDWGGCRLHVLADKASHFKPGDEIFPRLLMERAVLWPG
jgi:multiple sugar transport system ATP-binding protein